MLDILTDDHYEKILDCFECTTRSIKIISPFLSMSMAQKLSDVLSKNPGIKCKFITRFYMEDMFAKSNSIDAIELLMNSGVEVYALKGLHTKLYLFDNKEGILGSANFTAGGFKSNFELSMYIYNEHNIIKELHLYFDELLEKIKRASENIITKEVISDARERYKALLSQKKGKGINKSTYMYGASIDKKTRFETCDEKLKELKLCEKDIDIVNDMFREKEKKEHIVYNHNIWLKFSGEADRRLNPFSTFPIPEVLLNGKKIYLANYPWKVGSVKKEDEIYFAALTTDVRGINLPVIVGRGYLREYSMDNEVKREWLEKYDWMERYPYYTVIDRCWILNTNINNGIALDTLWHALGADTYLASYGREEEYTKVAKKHYQKAHIRLSGNAKQYIDKKLDELGKIYGMIGYKSE